MAALPEVLAEMGSTAALVVVERPVAGIPSVAAAVAGLAVFEKEPGEPTAELIEALVQRMHAGSPDALVAIGGGSALDLAKGARAAYSQRVPFARLLAGDVAVAEPELGLVTVPTTAGTGSEVSGGCVVVDRARAQARASPRHARPARARRPAADARPPARPDDADGGRRARAGDRWRDRARRQPGSVALGLEAVHHIGRSPARGRRRLGSRGAPALACGSLMAVSR